MQKASFNNIIIMCWIEKLLIDVSKKMIKRQKSGGKYFHYDQKETRICVFTFTRYSIYYTLSLMLKSLPTFFVILISKQDINVLIHVCGF